MLAELAQWLVLQEDAGTPASVGEDVTIRQFNKPRKQTIQQLHESLRGMKVISTRAYLETPQTLANDLAADFRDSSLPEDLKRDLTPSGVDAVKRANVTAAKWIAASLMTAGADPIGVLVLWREPHKPDANQAQDADDAAVVELPVFILVRGEAASGTFRIREICYGDPLPLGSSDTKSDVADTGDHAGD